MNKKLYCVLPYTTQHPPLDRPERHKMLARV